MAVPHQVIRRQGIFAGEIQFGNPLCLTRLQDPHRQQPGIRFNRETNCQQFVFFRKPGGCLWQKVPSLVCKPRPGCLGTRQNLHDTVHQGIQNVHRIKASQFPAESQKQVHFLQVAAGFFQQVAVLQCDRNLADQPVIHLPVFFHNLRQWSLADSQDSKALVFGYGEWQGNYALCFQGMEQRSIFPFRGLVQGCCQEGLSIQQYLPKRILLSKERFRVDARFQYSHNFQNACSIRSLLANDGVVHSHSIEQFHSHGMQYLADITLAGSFFSDFQATPNPLLGLLQSMNRQGMFQVPAQQGWKALHGSIHGFLRLASLLAGDFQVLFQGIHMAVIFQYKPHLHCQQIKCFQGLAVRSPAIQGNINSHSTQWVST